MKNDTIFMFLKGFGLVGASMAGAYQSGISQWANDGAWPGTINWHNIIAGVLTAGFTALVAYCSGTVSTWKQSRNGSGDLPAPPPSPKL